MTIAGALSGVPNSGAWQLALVIAAILFWAVALTSTVWHFYSKGLSGGRPSNEAGGPPLAILFDAANPGRKFWSMETVKDASGKAIGNYWEYRAEIKNTSPKTVRNVSVTIEAIGPLPYRPTDAIFDKIKQPVCDLKPGCSELAPVVRWPIPIRQAGMLVGDAYGPLKITASGDDVPPTFRTFRFNYESEPMLSDDAIDDALELQRRAIAAQEEHTAELRRQRELRRIEMDPHQQVLRERQKRLIENPAAAMAARVTKWLLPFQAMEQFVAKEILDARNTLVGEAETAHKQFITLKAEADKIEANKPSDYDSYQQATARVAELSKKIDAANVEFRQRVKKIEGNRILIEALLAQQLLNASLVARGFRPDGQEEAIPAAQWRTLGIDFMERTAVREHDKSVAYTGLEIGKPMADEETTKEN